MLITRTGTPCARLNLKGDMVRAWIAERGLHILNPEGLTHRDGGVIDLALGPARAFAEFAHWTSDHRALVISVPSRPSSCLPPPKRLPEARFEEAAHLLRSFPPAPANFDSREELEQFA